MLKSCACVSDAQSVWADAYSATGVCLTLRLQYRRDLQHWQASSVTIPRVLARQALILSGRSGHQSISNSEILDARQNAWAGTAEELGRSSWHSEANHRLGANSSSCQSITDRTTLKRAAPRDYR